MNFDVLIFIIFYYYLEFDKVPEEIEPEIKNESLETMIIYMTAKHNHNIKSFLSENKLNYYDNNDKLRGKLNLEPNSVRGRLYQNEHNPERDLNSTSEEFQFIFLPELLSAMQQGTKVRQLFDNEE